MAITPTRVVLLFALALVLATTWYVDGRGRWREIASSRLVYGVPWGTALTVAVLFAFYLFAQGGLRHWDEPVMFAFITWSYFYPTGLLTAGLAHAGPEHLLSNATATLIFGPIAEYAWGHYPRSRWGEVEATDRPAVRADGAQGGPLARPWVRALVAFPAALFVAALFTAVFSLGPGLGFSGAVFAIVGFAVVVHPLAAVVGLTAASGLSLLVDALVEPVVRETVEAGPPMPPEWAGIGFHAHLLGFLVGVVAAIALLSRRPHRRPSFSAVAFGVILVGTVQALWLLAWTEGADEFVLYRGAGLVLVFALALVIAGAVAGSDRRIPRPLERFDRVPSRRTLSIGWLVVVALGFLLGVAGVVLEGEALVLSIATLVVLSAVLAVPGLAVVLPDRLFPTPVSRRHAAITSLVVVTALVALVSVPVGLTVVDRGAMPDSGAVTAEDYAVTYAENATSEQDWVVDVGGEELEVENVSGVVVVSDERELWTVGVTEEVLAFEGEETVTVGDAGWRETVQVERTGWEVLGNETAYAVDLEREADGETTRAYTSDPVRANAEIGGQTVEVVPTDDGFDLEVRRDGEVVDVAAIPQFGESTTVGDLTVSTVDEDGTTRVIAEGEDAQVQVAERETYP